jgi:cytochrome o ubiquinol oxidase subunit 2
MPKLRLNTPVKVTLFCLLIITLVSVIVWYVSSLHIAVLNPKGIIALKERNLLAFTTILGFIVVIPVFIMAIAIAWRYREGNTKAAYTPNWSTNRLAESIWWGIPIVIILILSVVTWTSTHELDPQKALASDIKPLTIKVVALDWKWLFIYPEQNIATVNYIQFPAHTPITFDITADAPMNSFWIPQLGGQIYAMPGMTTHLHLDATENGDYQGSSANISGSGFATMKFTARASSASDFTTWVKQAKQSPDSLTMDAYAKLAAPSKSNPAHLYRSSAAGLYDTIVMKYMMPPASTDSTTTTADNTTTKGMDTMNTTTQAVTH